MTSNDLPPAPWLPWGLPDFVPLLRHSDAGADFVANVAASWWEWEDPLPVVFAGLRDLFPGAFYDVGANTGFYSVLMARLDHDRVVRAFEPIPDIAHACAGNLALAGVADRVTIERVALSDADGPAEIYLPPAEGELIETKASLEADFLPEVAGRTVIDCATLDQISSRFDGEPLGMMKVDVEGAEARVLRGGGQTIGRDRPLISVELLDRGPLDAISTFLRNNSYSAVVLRPGLAVEVVGTAGVADPAGWNQLLVPVERLPAVMARLSEVAQDYHRAAEARQSPEAALHLADQQRQLPVQMLIDQLAIRARLIETLSQQSRTARFAAHAEAQRLDDVLGSASWRATAPLRTLRAKFQRD